MAFKRWLITFSDILFYCFSQESDDDGEESVETSFERKTSKERSGHKKSKTKKYEGSERDDLAELEFVNSALKATKAVKRAKKEQKKKKQK